MTEKERKLALYCLKASSDYHSEVCEECINYSNCDHTIQDDVTETIIKELEQTDGDLISRQAVNKLRKYNLVGGVHTVSLDDINKLPSARGYGDLISRTDLLNAIWQKEYGIDYDGVNLLNIKHIDIIEQMPSAEKTAEWIFKTTKSAKCSNCGYFQFTNGEDMTKNVLIHKAIYHYCPNCGAKMQESEEEKE